MRTSKIAVIIYTSYHHVSTLAESIKQGLESAGTSSVTIFQVPETLSDEVLKKIHVPPKPAYPIATPETIKDHDGIMFGFPTRFGVMPAQIKAFFDSTGCEWMEEAYAGKPVGCFTSTNLQHGGQESTIMSILPVLAHHGMIFVPLGRGSAHLTKSDEIVGGSAWGAGAIASNSGTRRVSEVEKEIAFTQGKNFAAFVAKLVNSPC
ncbi:NAD(P)H:quinone oxidoreductase, type IV [Blastocladiella britannica]|nr:NAD(P)H:quinone oxidoreductase, type IV [Blastocladiella britannica]